jgi:hypothetical protein
MRNLTLLMLACAVTLAWKSTDVHAGSIWSVGFESGLENWSSGGTVKTEESTFGHTPTKGDYQAVLNTGAGLKAAEMESHLGMSFGSLDKKWHQGAAIWQTISLSEGDSIAFDWNFLETQSPAKKFDGDFAFWTLVGSQDKGMASPFELISTSSSISRLAGYQTTSSSAVPSAGKYTLGFGVINVGNNSGASTLLIGNLRLIRGNIEPPAGPNDGPVSANSVVPEPGTFAIFGVGAIGLIAGGLRRRKNAPIRLA